ncbi:MAG TPA: 16S rRNA (guanine(966)-N(2))-methyltransferase RsmD [Tissierellaceae bacterium]|nr:16S rRNA (guanine(966)-N(2))-methyltransferase RsmD [Tissierellaceae bacterium]
MRVISGSRKGHRLKAPKGNRVRPTEDRIKESLFNILGEINKSAIVLDAFAGSGSIGIEFLSRGAKEAYFVDDFYGSIATIKDNLEHTKLIDRAKIIKVDIFLILKRFNKDNLLFDYIYLDPPFNQEELVLKLLKEISSEGILNKKGIIIIEHGKNLQLENSIYDFKKIDYRKYGSKLLTFYKIKD